MKLILALVTTLVAAAPAAAAPPPLAATDPGFEQGGEAWTLTGGAQVSSPAPKTGTRHTLLPGPDAVVRQAITAPATGS